MAAYINVTVIEIKASKGLVLAGAVFESYPGPFMLIKPEDVIWFDWASKRNIVEGAIKLLNVMRERVNILYYDHIDNKRFLDYIAKHGISRRIGHIHDIYEDGPAVLFQTKTR